MSGSDRVAARGAAFGAMQLGPLQLFWRVVKGQAPAGCRKASASEGLNCVPTNRRSGAATRHGTPGTLAAIITCSPSSLSASKTLSMSPTARAASIQAFVAVRVNGHQFAVTSTGRFPIEPATVLGGGPGLFCRMEASSFIRGYGRETFRREIGSSVETGRPPPFQLDPDPVNEYRGRSK